MEELLHHGQDAQGMKRKVSGAAGECLQLRTGAEQSSLPLLGTAAVAGAAPALPPWKGDRSLWSPQGSRALLLRGF